MFRAKGVSEIGLGDISEHVVTMAITLVLNWVGVGRKRTQLGCGMS